MLETLSKVARFLPVIKPPSRQLTLKERLFWTLAVAIVYFTLMHATAIGVIESAGQFDFIQMITASRIGSLLTLGIGPIVIASIVLQLLAGAGVIKLNLHDPKDKQKFHEVQRVLAILIAIFEAYIYTSRIQGLQLISPTLASLLGGAIIHLIAFQFVLGAIIVIYLDEIVTKFGIGSGIGLFIAQGVSYSIFSGAIYLLFGPTGILTQLSTASANALSLAIVKAFPLISTIIVFLVVVFGEGVKIHVPFSLGSMRGMRRTLPFPLFYVSNIPVIFAAALLLNVVFLSQFLTQQVIAMEEQGQQGLLLEAMKVLAELTYLMTPITMLNPHDFNAYLQTLLEGKTPIFKLPQWVHAITYVITMALLSVLFGILWVEMAGMDAKSIAEILYKQGMKMPGFRMNKKLLEMELNKYIFPLTVLGSLAVGLLAGIADLFGALGTGTGILLTVNILHRMEPQVREAVEMYFPALAKVLFGE